MARTETNGAGSALRGAARHLDFGATAAAELALVIGMIAAIALSIFPVQQAQARLPKQYAHAGFIGQGELSEPAAMDVGLDGKLYVADRDGAGYGAIKVFGLDGSKIAQYDQTTPAFAREQFVPASGIHELAVDQDGSIFFVGVAERMHKYTPSSDTLSHYAGGDWFELFAGVSDFVTASGAVYVAHSGDGKVHKLDPNLNHLTSWGTEGNERAGELWQPDSVTVDRAGNVYVLSSWQHPDHRVQKFTSDGRYVRSWHNAAWDRLSGVGGGLAVDPKKNDAKNSIYVTDRENDRIYKINAKNRLLTYWGGSGSGRGKLSEPDDIEYVSPGKLYVLERGNKRIQVFQRRGR